MNWKQVVPSVVVGAILGIASTLYVQGIQIAGIRAELAQLRTESERFAPGRPQSSPAPSWPNSPDGEYRAVRISSDSAAHYEVVGTGGTVMTTHAQYPETPNDVKAGLFSPDSTRIAAAYHYGHEKGNYTWVGIWDIETGNLVDTKRRPGWTTDIYWVFKDDRE